MDLVEKYIGEKNNEYIHIVYDPKDVGEEWTVKHSVHYEPQAGGQVLKTFKDKMDPKMRDEVQKFANKLAKKWGASVHLWKKQGNRWISYPYVK